MKHIRQMSVARARQYAVYRQKRREYLEAHPLCEAHERIEPGQKAPKARDIHHSRGRNGELLNATEYWFAVCRGCHTFIGSFVKRARALGLIAPEGQWNTTAKTKHERRKE